MRRRGSGDSWGMAQALGLGEWGSFLAWELVRTGLGAGFTSAAWIRCATLVITLERTKRPRETQVGEKMLETLTQMPLRATIPYTRHSGLPAAFGVTQASPHILQTGSHGSESTTSL